MKDLTTYTTIGERLSRQRCAVCGAPASCFGVYELETPENRRAFACDECCGHGNEDGWCVPIEDMAAYGIEVPEVSGV